MKTIRFDSGFKFDDPNNRWSNPSYQLEPGDLGYVLSLYRESGRAPRDERIYQAVAGQWRERPRIIAASQHGKLGAPLVFPGRCHTEVVDASFEPGLLPELPPGRGIVRDNARFHQSPTTQRLVEAAGGPWLFLPASSPDLNPLEHLWAAFKTRLRKDLPAAATPFLLIANISQCYC